MKKASYLKGLKVSKYREGLIVGWMVDGYLREKDSSGKPKRIRKRFKGPNAKILATNFKDEKEALDLQRITGVEVRQTKITDEEEHVINDLINQLREDGGDEDTPGHVLLGRAVRHFLDSPTRGMEVVTVAEGRDRYLARKGADKLSDKHARGVKSKLDNFCSLFGDRLLSSITAEEVDEWVEDRQASDRTKETYYNAIHALFEWCRKKCLISNNVVGVMDKPVAPSYGEPKSLFVDQIFDLFRYADLIDGGRMIPYLVFNLFGGVRPEEIARGQWGDFDWDEKTLRVRQRKGQKLGVEYLRAVEIPEVGMKWLEYYLAKRRRETIKFGAWWPGPGFEGFVKATNVEGENPLRPRNGTKLFNLIRACAGWRVSKGSLKSMHYYGLDALIYDCDSKRRPEWPHNALRHTGITYRYKQVRSIGEVAEWAGNSERMIQKHYKSVKGVTKQTTEDFFNLTPENLGMTVEITDETVLEALKPGLVLTRYQWAIAARREGVDAETFSLHFENLRSSSRVTTVENKFRDELYARAIQ
jgi:integrase